MTECCVNPDKVGSASGGFTAAEVTVFDMISTAAYRMVAAIEAAVRRYNEHASTMRALDRLQRLDDRHLADMGISREDLTVEGLAEAAARREHAIVTMGNRA